MKYKYIIFDCFGTLVSDSEIALKSKALKKELTETEQIVYLAHWRDWHRNSYSLDRFMSDISSTGMFTEEKIKLIKDRVTFESFNLFPDTLPTLKSLKEKGYKLAILSNASPTAKRLYKNKPELNKLIDEAFWSCDLGCGKPEKQIFNMVIGTLECKKEEVLYLGDSYENDYLGAKSAGIDSVLLDRENKFNFEHSIKSLKDLIKLC